MTYITLSSFMLRRTIKILDFGTSVFTSKNSLNKRHRRVIHETYKAIMHPFDIDKILNDHSFYGKFDTNNPSKWYKYYIRILPRLLVNIWATEAEKDFHVCGNELDHSMKSIATKLKDSVDYQDIIHFLANCNYEDKEPFWPLDIFELSGKKGHAPMYLTDADEYPSDC